MDGKHVYAIVDYDDVYVLPLILKALQQRLPPDLCHLIQNISELPSSEVPMLQFRDYEAIDFERALHDQKNNLVNAYIIRKALIRKHYLSNTIHTWKTKLPDSVFKDHFKAAVDFEVDYSEFLDDALQEAYELRDSFAKNEDLDPSQREWWILKPSMTDRGQGIRLFSRESELQSIFEEWDPSDSDDEDEAQRSGDEDTGPDDDDRIPTSQLRHFIAQPYIHPPLLLPSSEGRKFHIRTYVLAAGALKVYVYKPMLALFAAEPYAPPWEQNDLKAHLTNTCLQSGEREGSVRAFWSLDDAIPNLPPSWKDEVFTQICTATAELFTAAAKNNGIHFQPLPNAFELFGLDYLVDAEGTVWLLEVNAFPDFKQTGEELRDLVAGLFEEVVEVAVMPFFGVQGGRVEGSERMRKVLDLDMGRG